MKHILKQAASLAAVGILLSGCGPAQDVQAENVNTSEQTSDHASEHAASINQTAVQTTDLGQGVYMLATGKGGNMALAVGVDSALLVDDEFAQSTPAILSAVRAITDLPIRYLINTHYHGDHTGGNENIAQQGVTVLAHHNVHKRMSTPQKMDIELFGSEPVPASPPAARPHITYGDGTVFHMDGQHVIVSHVPNAHTDGDSHVYFQDANVLHMGDTFFNGLFPFIDTQAGGRLSGMIAVQEFVLAHADPDVVLIPGHGPIGTLNDLKKTTDMLKDVHGRIAPHYAAGKSLEDVKGLDPLAGLEAFASFISKDAMVELAYHSLSRSAEQ